jgi:hypothetical protein
MNTDPVTPMGIREKITENKYLGLGAGVGLVVVAGLIMAATFWPTKQADLNQAYYSDDDGKTWFTDSAFRVAPFDRNGKTAVVAHVYNYAGGSKEFCAYLAKFTPDAKAKLEAALAEAQRAGKPANSVWMWSDRTFMTTGVLVKRPGEADWITLADDRSAAVTAVKSPDGSEFDQSFVK